MRFLEDFVRIVADPLKGTSQAGILTRDFFNSVVGNVGNDSGAYRTDRIFDALGKVGM